MKSIAVKLITLLVVLTLSASIASAGTGANLEKQCSSWTVNVAHTLSGWRWKNLRKCG